MYFKTILLKKKIKSSSITFLTKLLASQSIMETNTQEIQSKAIKLTINNENNEELARAFLFLITNDLHKEPYGLIEDVFVVESARGQGLGKEITNKTIEKAKELGCYKLICTSRFPKEFVHEMYIKLGFKKHGYEFRMDF